MQTFKLARKYGPRVVGLSALAGVSAANAAVDVSAVVTEIAAALVPIGLVGGAVLLVYLGVKTYKWVRSAMA